MARAGMSECLWNSVRKTRTRSSVSGTARCEPTAAHASRASAQFKCLSSSLNQPTCTKDEKINLTFFFYLNLSESAKKPGLTNWPLDERPHFEFRWWFFFKIYINPEYAYSMCCGLWQVSRLIKQLQICLLQNVHTHSGAHPESYLLVTGEGGGYSDLSVRMATLFSLGPKLSISDEVILQLSLWVFLSCTRTGYLYLAVEYSPEMNTAQSSKLPVWTYKINFKINAICLQYMFQSLLYNGYRVFPGGKAAGAWCWPPTPI